MTYDRKVVRASIVGGLVLVAGCQYDPSRAIGVDASVVDTQPTFDRARCPASYDLRPADSKTAYRLVIDTKRTITDSSVDCRDDSAGLTHLVTLADRAELAMLRAELGKLSNLPDDNFWIGGVQLRDQPTPLDGWLSFAGGPLLDAWNSGEPNDTGDGEDNEENFVMIGRNRDLADDRGSHLAICECDGVPIDPAAQAAFDASKP